ncbi:phage portal protein [Sporosarcina sp. resist]|uniref:XkdQ/YqbQ family protein n=1 Tax=Sporosarcina sp. resist TaxID=2762563 RepID=UPI00164E82FA|nr:phage portal protein [Sporosarcina sp. resist]QNK87743.1 phage portal protein [Sporosarcina sp. resist]
MIELFLVKPGEMLEIPTESITWSGKRFNAARKIDARILIAPGTGRKIVNVEEGDTLLFKWRGEELFRGIVFDRSRTKNGVMSVTAHDRMQYLLINKTTRVFTNKRADQMATSLMQEFEVPIGAFANTGHVIKSRVFKNETSLYDIILDGLTETLKQTKQRFRLFSKKGKAYLEKLDNPSKLWVLETGVNIEDYTYSTSINDTATKVKLVAGEEKKQITASVTDDAGRKKFGVLQHYEKVTGKINQAQLTDRANKILADKKGVKKEFVVDARGIADLISGMPVRVIEDELKVNKVFFVDSDTHTFRGNRHTMTLSLIENNDMPEVS